jgi:predicted MFS family arabinose efflux permease
VRSHAGAASLVVAARSAPLRRAELAWGGLVAAEWAHFVALGVFAYRVGGTSAVGVAGVARMLPAAVLAPFAASLADRFRRERFLLAVAVIGASALVVSAIGATADERYTVVAAAAVVGISSTLFRPALQALLPSLATTPQELVAANSTTSVLESAGTVLGPVAAAALVSTAGVSAIFATGAATLVCSALLLGRLHVDAERAAGGAPGSELMQGFREIARVPGASTLVGLIVSQTFVRGCLNVLIVVAAFDVLDGDAADVGFLTAAVGLGGLAGAVGGAALRRRLSRAFALSLVFWGLPIVGLAAAGHLVVAILLLAVVGAANSVEDVAGFTLLQRVMPNHVLARVLGVVWGLAMGAVALGSAVAAAAVELAGADATFVGAGLVLPTLALVSYGHLHSIEASLPPAARLDIVEQVPIFAPLSLAAKEQIAGDLTEESVEPGRVVTRQGGAGDLFYIVGEGDLTVQVDGAAPEPLTGRFFGEIALLRDVPRTATVTAATHARLYSLRRDDFLDILAGHDRARTAANAVAAARLPPATHGGLTPGSG